MSTNTESSCCWHCVLQDSGTDRSESEEPEYPQMPSSPYSNLKEALIQLPKYSVEGILPQTYIDMLQAFHISSFFSHSVRFFYTLISAHWTCQYVGYERQDNRIFLSDKSMVGKLNL